MAELRPTFVRTLPIDAALTINIDAIRSRNGRLLTPSAAPTWSTSDATIATVTPAADGLSATVAAAAEVADDSEVIISVTANVDPGGGAIDVRKSFTLQVFAHQAVIEASVHG